MERNPVVTHLSGHLKNDERIYYTESNFKEQLSSPQKSTFTTFFNTSKLYKILISTNCSVPMYYN